MSNIIKFAKLVCFASRSRTFRSYKDGMQLSLFRDLRSLNMCLVDICPYYKDIMFSDCVVKKSYISLKLLTLKMYTSLFNNTTPRWSEEVYFDYYTRFYVRRFLELPLFVQRWCYRPSPLRCWQCKVLTSSIIVFFLPSKCRKNAFTRFK